MSELKNGYICFCWGKELAIGISPDSVLHGVTAEELSELLSTPVTYAGLERRLESPATEENYTDYWWLVLQYDKPIADFDSECNLVINKLKRVESTVGKIFKTYHPGMSDLMKKALGLS